MAVHHGRAIMRKACEVERNRLMKAANAVADEQLKPHAHDD